MIDLWPWNLVFDAAAQLLTLNSLFLMVSLIAVTFAADHLEAEIND